jgi:tRNA nucleotidyltransferase/poly(A) polymerase
MSTARRYRYRLCSVSSQRIGDEILKGLKGKCGLFWTLMENAQFVGILFPFVSQDVRMPFPFEDHPFGDLVKKLMALIEGSGLSADYAVSLLYLPQMSGKEDPRKQWGWPVPLRDRCRFRAQFAPFLLVPLEGKDIYRIFLSGKSYKTMADLFSFAELLAGVLPEKKEKFCLSTMANNRKKLQKILPVLKNREVFPGGGDIIELLHISPGPSVGRMRKALGIEIASGNVTSREEAVKYLRSVL